MVVPKFIKLEMTEEKLRKGLQIIDGIEKTLHILKIPDGFKKSINVDLKDIRGILTKSQTGG